MESGFKDPVRNKVQLKIESIFKGNYDKTLKLMKVKIAETLKNK